MSSGFLTSIGGLVLKVTQTLNDGDNTINHNLGKEIIGFEVKDVGVFVETSGDIIDNNNFNINLAGGGPINNAIIILTYIN